MKAKITIGVVLTLAMMCFAMAAMAQNQDANPYGHRYYNDHNDYRMYGTNVLPRTDHANLDTLTNVIKGDLRYDTLNSVVVYYDGSTWVNVISGGGNTLDEAYDSGGTGAGREIVADSGAVWVSGEDGFIVTGTYGSGDTSQWVGAGTGMFFEPKKGAFRFGGVNDDEWNDINIGDYSVAGGQFSVASGATSTALGRSSVASNSSSIAMGNSTVSSGLASASIGRGTIARSTGEIAVGLYNTDYTPTDPTSWHATDRLFVIGNGIGGTPSDALVMLKDGSTTLNGSLAIVTTTGAFTPPILTTTERNALTPIAGMMIYNSTTSKHQGYDGTSWNDLY